MFNSIPCGDLELNIAHPYGMPTLVPSQALERRLDWRLHRTPGLNSSKKLIADTSDQASLPPVVIHLHVHYLETLPRLLQALERCQDGLDNLYLWVSTDSSAKADSIEITLQNSSLSKQAVLTQVRVCPNRGRNLGPLLQNLWPEFKDEALVLHLHSKRSIESDLGEAWLDQLLKRLLPDGETIQALRLQFQRDPQLGLVMPQPPELIRPYLNWGNNFELAQCLAEALSLRLHRDAVLMFPAGGMFWIKPAALAPLVKCVNAIGELPPEPLPVDGSSLHALERLAAFACETSGHHWKLFCEHAHTPSTTPAELSVLMPQAEAFQQATSLLSARFRQQNEQLECASTNLDRCMKQLDSADATIRELDQTMTNSRTWRLRRFLRRLARVGT